MSVNTYVITSATSEVGTAIAQKLASDGHRLILLGRNTEKLLNIREQLQAPADGEHLAQYVDYSLEDPLDGKLLAGEQIHGIVLITPRPGASSEPFPPRAEWDQLFRSCFTGPLEILSQASRQFAAKAKVLVISGITSVQYYPALPLSKTYSKLLKTKQSCTVGFGRGLSCPRLNLLVL